MSAIACDSNQSQQPVRRRDRAAAYQAAAEQETGRRRRFTFGEGGGVPQRPPSICPRTSPKPMAAERQPIGGIHAGIAASEAREEAGVKVDKADDVESVVLERRIQQGMHVTAQIVEVSVWHEGAGDWIVALVSEQPLLDRPEIAALKAMAIERPDQT